MEWCSVMSVRVEKQGPVTTVVLSRPEVRNAVDGATARSLAEAFRRFDADPDAAVAVLWGEGGNFCSGADLKALGTSRGNRVDAPSVGASSHDLSHSAEGPMGPTRMRLSKPVIAAVSGYAVAGGLELAIWCDLRIVEEDAVFGVFCRRWGVPLVDGGTVRLPRLIGQSHAMDLILTGRAVPAREAREMGLANRVVPTGEARTAAEALAAEIAAFPQVCLRHDRMSALEQQGMEEDDAIAREFRHGLATIEETGLAAVQGFRDGAGRGGSSA
jgi:enoyl-CoA hydratase